MADKRKRFVELAREIIARIQEANGSDWWSDVEQLSETLETVRRKIGFPEWKYNEPEWPAFYITSVYCDADCYGIAEEFADKLKEPCSDDRLSRCGIMLSRDPMSENSPMTLLWSQERGSKLIPFGPELASQAILTLNRWIRTISNLDGDSPTTAEEQPEPKNQSVEQAKWLATAMLLVQEHPDWSDAKIAREVGKHPSTLSRHKIYQAAAAMARGDKSDRPRGHIKADPDNGQLDVEAYSYDPEEQDLDE
jgi:hypothetical protein